MVIHVSGGMGCEGEGTEHVAIAGFDVTGGHIKVGFRRFLLCGRAEVDEAGSKRKERKQQQTRHTSHDPSKENCGYLGLTGLRGVYPSHRPEASFRFLLVSSSEWGCGMADCASCTPI